MGFLCFCGQTVTALLTLCAFIAFMPGLPPDVDFSVVQFDPFKPLEGPLKKNNYLDDVEKLFDGQLMSPESVASRKDGEIFTSSKDGYVHRIWGKNWEKREIITKIGPNCDRYWEEHICGRGLGIRFEQTGKLVVADAYMGIFFVDVDTGKKQRLFDPSKPIEGYKPLIIDDIDIDSKGNIYWSDASYLANLADGLLAIFADPSGRLIKFDPKTKKNEVLVSNLLFANGVQLSPDESFVLVSETGKYRVQRYWLKGPKKGTTDIFVTGLPGNPDNIRSRKKGGYYISLVATKPDSGFDFLQVAYRYPAVRRLIIRVQLGLKTIVDAINTVMPNEICGKLSHVMLNLQCNTALAAVKTGFVVEVDETGKIIGSLQGSVIGHVSQTDQVGEELFFSSPYNNFLGRLKLSDMNASKSGKASHPEKDEL